MSHSLPQNHSPLPNKTDLHRQLYRTTTTTKKYTRHYNFQHNYKAKLQNKIITVRTPKNKQITSFGTPTKVLSLLLNNGTVQHFRTMTLFFWQTVDHS